ncbi:hypothetical protein HX045_07055 [Myroides odoratimimus]|uniref:hypothetical protein n=1 Tax=Myroides odoratimimus TaxID=76832 RepID=UPI000468579E|nr:hypothetical protein [Myroides odoratimimus]MCA4792978.1 hypothetical protein [Myroides odoratimimus]MCA4820151.1 hypothetical protein [Myroides odoratimimus]MDM1400537.1 hypothetical protein [Myroides odoratimimus]MDM1410876.1 hypothetical protein [Myroides odoratimimus]MDM1443422.1 hypothetical protein [Myroides odoratimimus]
MNQKEQKTRKKWGHLMYYGLLFIIMSFVQTSIAMYRFKDQPSGDITFNFFQDIFLSALFVSLFYILLLVFIIKIPRFSIQIIIHSMLLVGLWFLQDLSIFIDREASWSTYSFTESIGYTWMYSRISLLCALVIYIFLSFRLYRYYTK